MLTQSFENICHSDPVGGRGICIGSSDQALSAFISVNLWRKGFAVAFAFQILALLTILDSGNDLCGYDVK